MYANSTWKKKLTLLRDTEESFLKKIGISWVGRLNIIKMSFTSILICKQYNSNRKIPTDLQRGQLDKLTLKFIWKNKQPEIPRRILKMRSSRKGGTSSTRY